MNLTWISWMLKLKMFPFTLAKAVQVCSFLLVFGFLSLTVLEIEAHVSTEHFSVCISSNLSKQFQEKHTERTYSFLGAINHCHAPRCALSVLRSGLSCDMHEKKICTAVLANLELQSETTGWKGEIRDQISYGICVVESDWTMDFLSDQTACPSGPKLLFKKNIGSSTSTHWHSSNRPSPPTNSVVRLSGVCQKKA